ncbi:MAG: GTPase Era [Microthrixaceae bacterium]
MNDAAVHRSGFVTFVGRPNVGKSTLLNQILGEKISIVSDKPQTTRHQIRGILRGEDTQIVFVDTPGIHKPRTLMGERLNSAATEAMSDVDVTCLVLDATQRIGPGDRRIAEQLPADSVIVVNKVDRVTPAALLEFLQEAAAFDAVAWFPVSARTGEGVDALVEHLLERIPEGPQWYPDGTTSDLGEGFRVAELVREQLLAVMREELPHSIATRTVEWEWPRIKVEILVERESQKGMVIGKGGSVLKEVGTRVRRQLPDGAFLELKVRVERDWQSRPGSLEQLGY